MEKKATKKKKSVKKQEDQNSSEDQEPVVKKIGQKYDVPLPNDPTRAFYESLYEQRPDSKMAMKWCMEYGLLQAEEAQNVYKMLQKSNQLQANQKIANKNQAKKGAKSEGVKGKKKKAPAKKANKQTPKKKKRAREEESEEDVQSGSESGLSI